MAINCKGHLIDLITPKVMGILNLTPNSFYDGGKHTTDLEVLQKVERMLADGTTFIDVGAYSSKPNADYVSLEEEIRRILPTVKLITKKFPKAILSIDTFRSDVAKVCIEEGAAMVNDISAGVLDKAMLDVIADYQVPYIMMHMRGTPETMQKMTSYDNLVKEIIFYFSERITLARQYGINDLIIDPGFGFAKTLEQNYELLNKLELLKMLDLPILAGLSRKSMIYKVLDTKADQALNGTTALNMIALSKGAKILRVHDVKEAVDCVALFDKLNDRPEFGI